MSEARRQAARTLLLQVELALEGVRCEATTDCCRFQVTGREPWLTRVEWELLLGELRRQGRRLPTLPDEEDGRCPFLDESARCRVYGARPLGCRTHFCERAQPAPPRLGEFREAARRLAELSTAWPTDPTTERANDRDDDGKARPLTRWLAGEHERPPRPRRGRRR